ncbi:MAG: divergent polysaccharide deacetylase family protein, partial [Acidiferrobacterales bacterium]|nr:divergent polysaccharide deacetylase family protein [Acidiferrobacterales bacterium]
MPGRWLSAIFLLLIGISTAKAGNTALVSIVIDDLGYNHALARQALDLPGPVSYSILPELPDSATLARIAREKHRDVLLHIPMQAVGGQAMGPGGLSIDMSDTEIRNIVEADLATVPDAVGISNHM